jgi:hypothetical protein
MFMELLIIQSPHSKPPAVEVPISVAHKFRTPCLLLDTREIFQVKLQVFQTASIEVTKAVQDHIHTFTLGQSAVTWCQGENVGNVLTSGIMRYEAVYFGIGVPMLQRYVAVCVTISPWWLRQQLYHSSFIFFIPVNYRGRNVIKKELLQNVCFQDGSIGRNLGVVVIHGSRERLAW